MSKSETLKVNLYQSPKILTIPTNIPNDRKMDILLEALYQLPKDDLLKFNDKYNLMLVRKWEEPEPEDEGLGLMYARYRHELS